MNCLKRKSGVSSYGMSPVLMVLLSVIIWGSSVVATRIAGFTVGPVTLAFIRFVIASVLMSLIRLMQKEKQKPKRRDLFLIILSSAVGVTLYYIIENYGVILTAASTASLISGCYPAITLAIGALFFHEEITWNKTIGLLLALAGIFILSYSAASSSSSILGIVLLIIDGIFWALYNYIVQAADPSLSSFTITYYQTISGTLMFMPFLLLEKGSETVWNPSSVGAVLYLGVCCSTLAYMLYNAGLRGVSAFTAAAMLNVMPLAGTLLSALILHETVPLRSLLGGILIIIGVFYSSRKT